MSIRGMDTDAGRQLAQRVDRLAGQLTDIRTAVDRDMADVRTIWRGTGAERFRHDWETAHRPHLLQARAILEELRDALKRNADVQDQTSEARTVDSVTVSPDGGVHHQRHEPYTRDELATEEQRNRIDLDIKALEGNRSAERYPGAFSRAEQWAAELRANPNASAAELAAFDKYCFLIHTANINRTTVHEFAQISVDNYHEGAKAGVEGVVGTVGLDKMGDTVGKTLRAGEIDGVIDYGKSALRGIGVDAVAGGDVDGIVSTYDKQADAYLSALFERAHSAQTVSVVTGAMTMDMAVTEYDGRLAEMRIEAEKVGAWDFMTGTDNAFDSGLRGALKTVGGVNQALTISEVVGNWGKAGTADSIAVESYRQAAVGGMDSLLRSAESAGFAD